MRTKSILSMLILTAVVLTFGLNEARAGFPAPPGLPRLPAPPGLPGPNVHVNGYLPPPPGVNVQIGAERPHYVERERRVYVERERPYRHDRHYGHHERRRYYHEDHGNRYGHYRHNGHGRGHW